MSTTNLPPQTIEDSAAGTKLFFDSYGIAPLEFKSNEVEAAIGFFQSNGFDRDASIATASALLKQAKLEGVPVFQLLNNLKGFISLKLNSLVAEVLNNNRPATSTLGYKITNVNNNNISRNIVA